MSKPLRTAIIGCGVISPTHLDAIRHDGRAEVVALCDPVVERRRALAADIYGCSDMAEIFADDNIDAVHICTPHYQHEHILAAAVAAGKHVIQEKPLATTPAAIDAMVASEQQARQAGLVTACIFQHRFAPLARLLRHHIQDGDFGHITSGKYFFRCTRNESYYGRDAWRGTWTCEGGGLLINQAIHGIDLCGYFLGQPQSVQGRVGLQRMMEHIEVEDEAVGSIRYANGADIQVDAMNDLQTGWLNRIELVGELGRIEYTPDDGGRLLAIDHPDKALVDRLQSADAGNNEAGAAKAEYGQYHRAQISDWINAIEQGGAPHVSIAEGAWANRVVLGFYHTTALDAPVALPMSDYAHPVLRNAPAAAC